MKDDIFELKPKQKRVFNRLKKALEDCKKEGLFTVNRFGSLHLYDKELICGYGDMNLHAAGFSEIEVLDADQEGYNVTIAPEWADDSITHFYGLTKKGDKIYFDK